MLRIFLVTVFFSVFIATAVVTAGYVGWFSRPSFFREILVFFTLSNLALHWGALRSLNKAPEDFIRAYLIATVLRILFFGIFIYVLTLLDRPEAQKNTAFFISCYLLFTSLEVLILFRQINAQKPSREGQKRL